MSVTFTLARGNRVETEFGMMDEFYVNFANANARVVMDLCGVSYDEGLWGEIKGADLRRVYERGMVALNTRGDYSREESSFQGYGGCHIIMCGTTDDRVRQRIEDLLGLIRKAVETDDYITFG